MAIKASSSKVTCYVHKDTKYVHSDVSILEAARRTALSHCRAFDIEGIVEVFTEYEHNGRVINDSVKVRVERQATVVNPRNGEED